MNYRKETPYLQVKAHYGELCFFHYDNSKPTLLGVHCTITTWSKSVLRECRKVWETCLNFLALEGFKELVAVVLEVRASKTRKHFFELFGMRLQYTTQGYAVFGQEIHYG